MLISWTFKYLEKDFCFPGWFPFIISKFCLNSYREFEGLIFGLDFSSNVCLLKPHFEKRIMGSIKQSPSKELLDLKWGVLKDLENGIPDKEAESNCGVPKTTVLT